MTFCLCYAIDTLLAGHSSVFRRQVQIVLQQSVRNTARSDCYSKPRTNSSKVFVWVVTGAARQISVGACQALLCWRCDTVCSHFVDWCGMSRFATITAGSLLVNSCLVCAVSPEMTSPAAGYRLPPPEIVEIIDQPPEPSLSFSPDRKKVWRTVRQTCWHGFIATANMCVQVLQLYRPPPLPPITELARPELKLAGQSRPLQLLSTLCLRVIKFAHMRS